MQSKKSLFHKAAFRKNMTRFAPVWVLYTLFCSLLLILMYASEASGDRCYWFGYNLIYLGNAASFLNLIYALLVAQLLFGDLYNSRMCYALHALPLRRESWFVTNIVSGLTFSLLPTLVAALVSLPLLAGSIFVGAWRLAFLSLLMVNLQFVCYFGLAVFSAMCVGNRFSMVAGYGLLNAGSEIAYWAVSTMYTPLLRGVLTPTSLAQSLSPIWQTSQHFYEYSDYTTLSAAARAANLPLSHMTATFTPNDQWWRLWVMAGVGLLFLAAALLLYRKRPLECAGDAVAFPFLKPVFQVLCTLFIVVICQYVLAGMNDLPDSLTYGILVLTLAIGWFIGKMLVARSTRVFGRKNWYGLGILALVLALSFTGTYFDIFGIVDRLPNPEKVESVSLSLGYSPYHTLEDEESLELVTRLHRLALAEELDRDGIYAQGYDGSFVQVVDTNDTMYDIEDPNAALRNATRINIRYHMENGKEMRRFYYIWTDGETGDLARQLFSRWDVVTEEQVQLEDGRVVQTVDEVSQRPLYFMVNSHASESLQHDSITSELVQSFLDALRADCKAGNMVQQENFHRGIFRAKEPEQYYRESTPYYYTTSCVYVTIGNDLVSWSVAIYPDCENTMRWVLDHGFLGDMDILPDARSGWPASYQVTEG